MSEPRKEWDLRYTISAGGTAPRSGAVVLTARGAVVRRGEFQLGPLDLQVDIGDRIGITGPNGSGKSSLLALLLGRLPPDAGAVSIGASVAIGEVDQARALFAVPGSLLDVFAQQLPELTPADLRTLLAKFGLTADHVVRQAISLSPGERTRAGLALLQAKGVNLLVLDEPTNHLDLPAIEQLEQALDAYRGTLLLITHDRRMLDSVHLTRRWMVAGRDGSASSRRAHRSAGGQPGKTAVMVGTGQRAAIRTVRRRIRSGGCAADTPRPG